MLACTLKLCIPEDAYVLPWKTSHVDMYTPKTRYVKKCVSPYVDLDLLLFMCFFRIRIYGKLQFYSGNFFHDNSLVRLFIHFYVQQINL